MKFELFLGFLLFFPFFTEKIRIIFIIFSNSVSLFYALAFGFDFLFFVRFFASFIFLPELFWVFLSSKIQKKQNKYSGGSASAPQCLTVELDQSWIFYAFFLKYFLILSHEIDWKIVENCKTKHSGRSFVILDEKGSCFSFLSAFHLLFSRSPFSYFLPAPVWRCFRPFRAFFNSKKMQKFISKFLKHFPRFFEFSEESVKGLASFPPPQTSKKSKTRYFYWLQQVFLFFFSYYFPFINSLT